MESNIETAKWISKNYRDGAISYCEGRKDGIEDVIEAFVDNGSHAILDNWEDELEKMAQRWKKISEIIKKMQHENTIV